MPYLPPGATAAQLEAFARRLTQQLAPPSSRKSLMTVREAFARGAGYSDAHAMEAAACKDKFWTNPLVALGRRRLNLTQSQSPVDLHATKISQWASMAWKRHKSLLGQQEFTLDHTRCLLANLWSHASWDQALKAARDTPKPSGLSVRGLVMAPSLDALMRLPTSHTGNFSGIHRVLGETSDGQWVGLNWSGALTHVRVIGEDRKQRYTLASQWISQRVLAGDHVFLVDASEDGSVSQAAMDAAAHMGIAPCRVDLTQGTYMDNLHQMTASGLTALVLALLDYPQEHQGVLISWIAKVALRWKAGHRFDESNDPASLVRVLGDPVQQSHWWNLDVGLPLPNESAQTTFARLPADFSHRLKSVESLWKYCLVNTSPDDDRLFHSFTIIRLPFLLSEDPAMARKMVAMATLPWRDHLAQGLGKPLEGTYENIIDTQPDPLERIPWVCCHIDIPVQYYARGEAVVPAQSRALGISNLLVGPRRAWAQRERHDEVLSMRANVNTEIYLDPGTQDGPENVPIEPGQWLVVHAGQAQAVWPVENQDDKQD